MFAKCLQRVQTYLQRLEQEEAEERRARIISSIYRNSISSNEKMTLSPVPGYDDDSDDDDGDVQDRFRRVVGPSMGVSTSSLESLFNYSLCGIDNRYFVYTKSIKIRIDAGDGHGDDPMEVDDEDHHQQDHHHHDNDGHDQIDSMSYSEMVAGVLIFNIAQVYHIAGLQQEERRRGSSGTLSSDVEDDGSGEGEREGEDDTHNEGSNLLKAEQMYCLSTHLMHRRVQDYISLSSSSSSPLTLSTGNATNALSVAILVTLGALNNLATLQLRRQDHQARTTMQHLLQLLSSLPMILSSATPSTSITTTNNNNNTNDTTNTVISGILPEHERNGMLCNCLLVLLRGNPRSPSSSSTSNDDDCITAPAA